MYSTIDALQQEIEQRLQELKLECEPKGLYEPIRYVISIGGKRIRPLLMLMAYNLFRDDPAQVMPQAMGIEMYHNFTLLHDDLMDKADMRRNKPTVHKVWDTNTAILSGDAMMALAYRLMMERVGQDAHKVMEVFNQTSMEICEGQQMDMDFESRHDVTADEYIEMIRLKTSVLLACALKIGAIRAHAPEDSAQLLYEYGIKMGLAFQLQDDFLDVYGNTVAFGKQIGGDILCNKKTYLLISAFEHASAAQREALDKWLIAKTCDPAEKIAGVTSIYDALQVGDRVQELIRHYYGQAEQLLGRLDVDASKKQLLHHYANKLLARNA